MSADERRGVILEAAIIEFAAFGLHGASTEAIAERAGISQPYVFRLFGTKKELFMGAVDLVCKRIMDELRSAVEAYPGQSLESMAHCFGNLLDRRDELVLLLQAFAAAKDPDALEIGRQRLGEMYAYVAQVSGANDEELRLFFAHGMLMVVAASMQLPEIAATTHWAWNLSYLEK
jgi:AcrR family transcriptional regulator